MRLSAKRKFITPALMRSFLSDALRTTMSDPWLPSLITETPQAGFELAIKLSRMGVKMTQPSDEIRKKLRVIYETMPTA
jgi:hypothetical protein